MSEFSPIAYLHSDFPEKFGLPRQSGLVNSLKSYIVFEPQYRVREAFRGLEEYSHIWILWEFSESERKEGKSWSPTVRPPKLGGNKRMGVFATRSPFRPNPIAMSAVKLEKIDFDCPNAPVLVVSGADIMDNTPILDIKPYLAYTDSYPDASSGFALAEREGALGVEVSDELLKKIPEEKREGLKDILKQDPRPAYQENPERVYVMEFGEFEVSFKVGDGVLTVTKIEKI
ncbi:MAG: tRNA (N6-threonylcarbamoyladenosine(37)-N6)-methyltransferase TrmO [Ruminiclostridium sp.]|nr:tRNA (N6-threonylcarbamoyladenosine(37)-N6)-methyltransferase TrmO [Ruminiclostridium sp.]